MEQKKLPPPWVIVLLGGVFIFWSYQHYCELADFDAGLTDRMLMWSYMSALYDVTGFWPTAILPFVFSGAILLSGIWLQVRDLLALARGEAAPGDYEPVRIRGLLTAMLLAVAIIAVFIGLAFLIRLD